MKIAVITPVLHLKGVKELLESKGEVWFYELASKDDVRNLLLTENIETIICNPNRQDYYIDEELLKGTSVKLINTCSTGMNHIDEEYVLSQGIEIYNLKTDFELLNNLPSTSELALTLMLSLLRHLVPSVLSVKDLKWDYTPYIGRMCSELTVGIVGYGRLGKMMAKFCDALCKEVLVYDPYVSSSYNNVDSLEELFEKCDVISLHVHVNDETKYIINSELLGKSKKFPYIINTSRGEIVVEKDIVQAIKDNIISGYGTDVIEDEFGDISSSPIISAMNEGLNVIATPHTGGMTLEGQELAFKWAINKL